MRSSFLISWIEEGGFSSVSEVGRMTAERTPIVKNEGVNHQHSGEHPQAVTSAPFTQSLVVPVYDLF